ncbi:hypothetical protein Moror_1561 [Moniliophthora roreri MCA 2997]|uniref:Uncharacterized protein n=2 Tax=Moniliophthora roreri TaxID=221103 RepID=V2XM32_MONRO|nr:hypothetical protein Moror_1561 [Moniliophthora roreri MCA 2997]
MSISVDDLVSSLSSSHIGQEALDLAALQTQLAQALFMQHAASTSISPNNSSGERFTQPCNTPTGRTPSSSISWGQMMDAQRTNPTRWNSDESFRELDDAEDERMVEDILLPSSPVSPGPSSSSTPFVQHQSTRQSRSQSRSGPMASPVSPGFGTDSSPSIFATTDPFYLAQLQALQSHNSSPASVFTQLGRPSQQSPFVHQQQKLDSFGYPSPISLTTTSSGFQR